MQHLQLQSKNMVIVFEFGNLRWTNHSFRLGTR